MKRRKFLPGSGFLSRRDMTSAVESGVITYAFLPLSNTRPTIMHIFHNANSWSYMSFSAARIFITGCPNWDFKNLGCPPSMIENLIIITLIMYINKLSNYICLILQEMS